MDARRPLTSHYLDSSVAVHAIVPDGDPRARSWLADHSGARLWSSALLRHEVIRVLRRDSRDVRLAAPVLDRVNLVALEDEVLLVAEAITQHVKSLDAIHLATCMLIGPDVTVVTHDAAMVRAARQLGFDTIDPIGDAA